MKVLFYEFKKTNYVELQRRLLNLMSFLIEGYVFASLFFSEDA